jgi:hypothetical protein
MSSDPSYKGPYPTPESQGIDKGYEAVRPQAEQELASTMAGPPETLAQISGEGIKNPDGEFAVPAAMTGSPHHGRFGPGPNQAGNSSGDGTVDPQGQQGGTQGGQAASPPLNSPGRTEGTPLAGPEERAKQSTQRKGAGVDTQF